MPDSFDQATCREFSREVVAALRPLAESYGLRLKDAGGSYDPESFTAKIKFTIPRTADFATHEREQFAGLCAFYGLKAGDYKKKFVYKSATWELCGFETGRPKYCVRARNLSTGKIILFSQSILSDENAWRAAAGGRGPAAPLARAAKAPLFAALPEGAPPPGISAADWRAEMEAENRAMRRAARSGRM